MILVTDTAKHTIINILKHKSIPENLILFLQFLCIPDKHSMLFLQKLRPGTHIIPSRQLKETLLVHYTLVMIRTNILPDIHSGII